VTGGEKGRGSIIPLVGKSPHWVTLMWGKKEERKKDIPQIKKKRGDGKDSLCKEVGKGGEGGNEFYSHPTGGWEKKGGEEIFRSLAHLPLQLSADDRKQLKRKGNREKRKKGLYNVSDNEGGRKKVPHYSGGRGKKDPLSDEIEERIILKARRGGKK